MCEASGADWDVVGFCVDLCFFVGCESVWSYSAVFADYHVVWLLGVGLFRVCCICLLYGSGCGSSGEL